MERPYYIVEPKGNDGPHDLVAIMRRIRTGKVLAATPIYIDGAEKAVPAIEVPDLTLFFHHGEQAAPATTGADDLARSLYRSIVAGWHFTQEHNVMTVYAGALLLMSFMLGVALVNGFGLVLGILLAWTGFLVFHHFYLLFTLRICRGQAAGSDFLNREIAPVLPTLLLSCALLALMMAGGAVLLLIPGIAVMVLYIFVPFLILDRRYRPVEAMTASRLLLAKGGMAGVARIAGLVVLHLACLPLIIPVPFTLPIFAASLARIYEELSAS